MNYLSVRRSVAVTAALVCIGCSSVLTETRAEDNPKSPSHGIAYPDGWEDWATIAVSHRNDNNTLRLIVGNDLAVQAATAPGEFLHAEFMFKDSTKFAETHGWGWARWVGLEQEAFAGGMQVCISCHTPVKDRDWVFTDPAWFPE